MADAVIARRFSYLSSRNRFDRVNGALSKPCPITGYVANVSVLCPLIFFMYISDIFHVIKHDTQLIFEDYIKLHRAFALLLFTRALTI